MEDVLTPAEIEARCPGEWALVENPEVDEQLELVRGKVIAHSKDRDQYERMAIALRPKSSASWYTGPVPEGVEFLL